MEKVAWALAHRSELCRGKTLPTGPTPWSKKIKYGIENTPDPQDTHYLTVAMILDCEVAPMMTMSNDSTKLFITGR